MSEPAIHSPATDPAPKTRAYSFKPMLWALAVLVLLDLALSAPGLQERFDVWSNNHVRRKLSQVTEWQQTKSRPLDVLFLGTSRTFNGFHPPSFEKAAPVKLSTFNMGAPQLGYDWMLVFLKDLVEKHGKPKLLLLETMDFIMNRDFFSGELYYQNLLATDPALLGDIYQSPLISTENKGYLSLSAVSNIHRYKMVLAPMMLPKFLIKTRGKAEKRDVYTQGWLPLAHSEASFVPDEKSWIRENFLPVTTRRLEAMLTYCQRENIPVALVEWPDYPPFRHMARHTKWGPAYREAMRAVAAKYNVPRIDLMEEPFTLNNALYADTRHLTPRGAMRVSERLGEIVFSHPGLRGLFTPGNDTTGP